MPKVGPWDGWRTQAKTLSLRWAPRAWTRPMVVVLFPSPRGVGVMLEGEKLRIVKKKYIISNGEGFNNI